HVHHAATQVLERGEGDEELVADGLYRPGAIASVGKARHGRIGEGAEGSEVAIRTFTDHLHKTTLWRCRGPIRPEEVGRIQDRPLAVLPDLQPGEDGGIALGEGVVDEDRMGWIDGGVPAADDAIDGIEDQGGRGARAGVWVRDLEVRRRVVD